MEGIAALKFGLLEMFITSGRFSWIILVSDLPFHSKMVSSFNYSRILNQRKL